MCEHYKYMLQLKPEFDIKFQKTGIHTQLQYLCEVEDVYKGNFKLHYDKTRFNLLIKECGKCHICRYKKASIKAAQCQCEFKTLGKGAFLTLTFGNKQIRDYLKNDKRFKDMSDYKKEKYRNYLQWTLEKREFQLFMKRLRWHFFQEDLSTFSLQNGYFKNLFTKSGKPRKKVIKCPEYDYSEFKPRKIRFMHCGEYGSAKSRPHHHCIILGVNFGFDYSKIRYSWKQKKNVVVHFNKLLNKLWQFGDITTDKVTYQSCNYVARYTCKKVVNKNKDYVKADIAGSIYNGRLPEYCTQSNRHGLGYDYYMKNAKKINSDLYLTFKNNKGEIKQIPLPRYFKELMKRHYRSDFLRMQRKSVEKQEEFMQYTPEFLYSRMIKDRNKIKLQHSKFVGDYECEPLNYNLCKDIANRYKSNIFGLDKMFSSYLDTEFVSRDDYRTRKYKDFENYRKRLCSLAINKYAESKYKNYDRSGQMLQLCNKLKHIKKMANPFRKEFIHEQNKSQIYSIFEVVGEY